MFPHNLKYRPLSLSLTLLGVSTMALLCVPVSPATASDSSQPSSPAKNVSGCMLWLDVTSLETGPDSAVKSWHDASGRGNDALQPNEALQPAYTAKAIGECPGLHFDGGDYLVTPLVYDWSRDWTVLAVAQLDPDAPNLWRGIIGNRFGKGSPKWWTLGTKSDGSAYLELGAGAGVHTDFNVASAGPQLYSIVKHETNFALYHNGVLLGVATIRDVGGLENELRVGSWFDASQGWLGCIGEVLAYDHALTEQERDAVEGDLGAKWHIPVFPGVYMKRDSWAETMHATRAALHAFEARPLPEGEECPDWVPEIWRRIVVDFPDEAALMTRELPEDKRLAWFHLEETPQAQAAFIGQAGASVQQACEALLAAHASPNEPRWLELYAEAAHKRELLRVWHARAAALRRSVCDLASTFPSRYEKAPAFLERIDTFEAKLPEIIDGLAASDKRTPGEIEAFDAFRRETLLANPLLDFKNLIVVKRSEHSPQLGLVNNWLSNCALPRADFDDAIVTLSLSDLRGELATLYKPERPVFVGDVDLHFDAQRMLFSSIGLNNCWQIFEVGADGTGLRQVTPGDQPDVDSYDPCYLADDRIVFASNAYMAAVPCINGGARTATLYRMNSDGTGIRQLCFDQEHNWCPTMLPNGRVMYLRWEYTDTPHSHDRVLFHMNPDGTSQMEYYGSNSYWPNSLFYARPTPGVPNRFVGIVSGHHGVPRMGELVLFDIERGRRESSGAVQRVCEFSPPDSLTPSGYGRPVASATDPKYDSSLIQDCLVDASWPKYLHPYPLSDKYFLVAAQPHPGDSWGIYLVDVFDNMLLLREEPGYALFEPIPLRKTPRPPIIPDRIDLKRKDGSVYLTDVYHGDGLKGIPRGTVKSLRIFTYHFLYPGMGGPQAVVGMEGPWDIKRIMGTTPVEPDGSAYFHVPANTPISVQPLDADGKAVQLMRSWFTVMPGETLSCAGCHESQNSSPPSQKTLAAMRTPSNIAPWHGPERGFNFDREVQPVLDAFCIRCHNGSPREDGLALPDFKTREHITDYTSVFHSGGRDAGHFSVAYTNLHRFVRRPGLESDYHLLTPLEFHADSTRLVQLLTKGHHGLRLDPESWDRIITWIDLNAPFHGTWSEIAGTDRVEHLAQRRRELLSLYAGMESNPEAILPTAIGIAAPPPASEAAETAAAPPCEGWPFDTNEARKRQQAAEASAGCVTTDIPVTRSVDLGNGVTLSMVLVPAGTFVMGRSGANADECPQSLVSINEPFWMGVCEVTNAQFEAFEPSHDSAVESRFSMQFGVRGFYVNGPSQPVVRVSWENAMAFCDWLADRTGEAFTLPTEAQWEYACRAGSNRAFFFGDMDADFSPYANLADQKLREFVCHTYKKEREPWLNASKYDDWIPKDLRFNDNGFLSDGVGLYAPNAWGLHDMHGNVCEWTRSLYRPYPYDDTDGRNERQDTGRRVARGGSWYDRPCSAYAAFRLAYHPYQPVYNVGFRVICPVKRKDAGAEIALQNAQADHSGRSS